MCKPLVLALTCCALALGGCVSTVVGAATGAAVGATGAVVGGAVKGGVAVGRAVIPGGGEEDR